MTPEGINPEEIAEKVRAAQERKDRALAEYKAALAELDWWREGQRLFDPASVEERTVNPEEIAEMFPPTWVYDNGREPTLRQAIVALMRENPGARRAVPDIAEELAQRSWLPKRSNAKESAKRVSDMAGVMVGDSQLERAGRGVYILAPELAAALDAQPRFQGRQASDNEEEAPAEADAS